MEIHVVKAGETLYSIAQFYGVSVADIINTNGLTRFNSLAVGQSLVIVRPRERYVVRPGDTLYLIAERFGVSVNSLYRANPFLNGSPSLRPGDRLVIAWEGGCEYDFEIGGYMYPFISDELLSRTLPYLDTVTPFTYGFRDDGSIVLLADEKIRASAPEYGVRTVMHLSTLDDNDAFDAGKARRLLDSEETQDALIANVLPVMRERGFTSLDVDFEFIGGGYAEKYARFISKMRRVMNENGYYTIVALAPKVSDTQSGELYEGHDYALLGEASDYVFLMTYEWGYTYGPPMAVSPVPSVRRVLDYASSRIESGKIYLGISNYGYDWTVPFIRGTTAATSISTQRAVELAVDNGAEIFYNENADAPYFFYRKGVSLHEVWFEDARSIDAKLRLVKEYSYRGALYWNFNRPNTQNLTLLAFACHNDVSG